MGCAGRQQIPCGNDNKKGKGNNNSSSRAACYACIVLPLEETPGLGLNSLVNHYVRDSDPAGQVFIMRKRLILGLAMMVAVLSAQGQSTKPAPPAPTSPAPVPTVPQTDEGGPVIDNGSIVLPKKKEETPPPPAPAEEKVKNPGEEVFSMRVDVPIVNLDVSVLLDRTHAFVPGLKADNFLVVEDGIEQEVQTIRTARTPITAVMLLEFASNSYAFIQDMQNASASFFHSLQPDDYVAVETYDMRMHVLTDFTNNKDTIRQALQSLTMPGFRETNEFDALYETLDRLSRVEGRKYIILISNGRDTMSRLTLDQMMAKIKATPNVTIYTISTGGLARELSDARGQMGGSTRMNYLQADNQMRTFAQMTGGASYQPLFQGELPDIFSQINESIRTQYVLTYKPTNNKNDGTFRKVKIYLVDNEGKPLKMQDEKGKPLKYSIIARDGYRAKLPVE
ncbi:VWFA-related domain-containing protein [Granulicella mallensis MP5ACTX8]|uniref:VWFA-related domain-containing protein n=2 Tax=Granulicella mallensis TaxID=940614 RepID=G8NT64_GRAMM|nr:VWFA-related domain-containing protein [Granulicella mallensis MP5ACTX8]